MSPRVEPFFDARTSTLTYVVWDAATSDAVVIDPVLDYDPVGSYTFTESADKVTEFVRTNRLRVKFILETHAHADHLSSAQLLKRRLDASVVIGRDIQIVQETFQKIFDLPSSFPVDGSQFDILLDEGEILRAGSLEIGAIATPGHTPACLTYQIGDAIFTGDVLFMDDYGTGRADFPKGSAESMYDSVRKLYALPDETRVFVGHDYQPNGRDVRWETTILASKKSNPQLSERTTKEDFVRMREARDATLATPRLLFQSVQLNINAGKLPQAHENGVRFFALPLNLFRPANELGEPMKKE